MPVKVVSTNTKSFLGEIKQEDLITMQDDFKNKVTLSVSEGRQVEKKLGWYLTKEQVDEFFARNTPAGHDPEVPIMMEINFAVNLNQDTLIDICQGSLKNSLTVVLRCVKNIKTEKETKKVILSPDNEFVLIPGFGLFTAPDEPQQVFDAACCPSHKPGAEMSVVQP